MDITTKIDALFIRACKTKNPSVRVCSVYRRFYLPHFPDCEGHIADILVQICEKNKLITLTQLINQMSPANEWMYPGETYWQKVMHVLISVIRHTHVGMLPDCPRPLKYRLKDSRDEE